MDDTRSNEKEYTIARMDAARLEDLASLHTVVYGRAPAKDFFARKYDTAYTGVQFIGYIAYNHARVPVAYYGVIPCFIQYRDRIILSAQSADTMTDPGYRYKGMFVELSKITFDLCRSAGIRFIFGFPNESSWHGAVTKLGWQHAGTMDRFTIPVKSLPLRKLASKFSWMQQPYQKYCRLILQKYTLPLPGLPHRIQSSGGGGVYRDEGYLQYKTYSPTTVIRAGDLKVWIRIRDGLLLGELQSFDKAMGPDDLEKTIGKLKKIARILGLPYITFIGSRGTRLHQLFSGLHESVPSFPVLIQDFGADIVPEELRFCLADIDIF